MRGSVTLRAAIVAAALSLGVAPSVAWAQNAALAEQLFSEGLAAMKAERWAAACDAFAASEKADPSPGTEINLGVCNEKQKKYATALTWYDTALRVANERNRPDKAQIAKAEHDRIAQLVHKLQVKWPQPVEGATISRNGEAALPASVMVDNDIDVDPGKYTLELAARGKKPVTKEVAIPETPGRTIVEFPVLEDAPVDATQPGGEPGVPGGPVIVSDGSGQRTVGVIVGGVGILALLTAGGLQILANNEDSKSKDFLTRANNPDTSADDRIAFLDASESRKEAAKNNQLIAIITGAGGVVLLGVGAVLFFTAPSSKASGKPQLLPVVGPGYAGGSFGLRF